MCLDHYSLWVRCFQVQFWSRNFNVPLNLQCGFNCVETWKRLSCYVCSSPRSIKLTCCKFCRCPSSSCSTISQKVVWNNFCRLIKMLAPNRWQVTRWRFSWIEHLRQWLSLLRVNLARQEILLASENVITLSELHSCLLIWSIVPQLLEGKSCWIDLDRMWICSLFELESALWIYWGIKIRDGGFKNSFLR